ncbi:dCTP deaminase [Tenacibaculum mesophilum]|uniref:dCTP deaminase n=1 Tax=Tenacibaculum mesophilum TaxID=104268 RepID=UPI0024935C09|nr:dCTP deaminase [Tenacibaculum mesophilum]
MDNVYSTLTQEDILKEIKKNNLYIKPLLSEDQIGSITIDLRVGTDFLTMHQGRDAFIDTSNNKYENRPIRSNFTDTRRKIGESFLLHPNQPIIFSSLEYIKLPDDIYGSLSLRSSYSRLGLTISTIVQPGYCGCLSIEIINSGNIPIKLVSGARILQLKLTRVNLKTNYFKTNRKYTCQVRPISSKANEDKDLEILNKINSSY